MSNTTTYAEACAHLKAAHAANPAQYGGHVPRQRRDRGRGLRGRNHYGLRNGQDGVGLVSSTSTPGGQPEALDGALGASQGNLAGLGERFWSKVDVGGPSDCWDWQAVRDKDGYGRFKLDGKMQKAHRLVIGLRTGDEGHALHSCDWPPCANPAHLSIGTNQDNIDHKVSRERQLKGEETPQAKLTEDEVLDIRARYATGTITQRALAEEYGVHKSLISQIVRRKLWAHLPNQQKDNS